MAQHPMGRSVLATKVARAPAIILAVFVSLAFTSSIAPAAAEPNADVAKVGVWMIGSKLSLAAISYFRSSGTPDQFFNDAKARASELGIDVKPFPPRPAKSSDGLLMILDYFNKGDGARIGADIRQKYGAYHATLYAVATQIFRMAIFYDLDPELGDKIAQSVSAECTQLGLPANLWKPATDAVAKRMKFEDVRSAAVQMNKDVFEYLIKVARGEVH